MTEKWIRISWYDFQCHLTGTTIDDVEVLIAINDEEFKKKVENLEYGFRNGSRLKVETTLESEVFINGSDLRFWQVSKVLDTEGCKDKPNHVPKNIPDTQTTLGVDKP